jgi:hypothetical protein
VIPFSVSHLLEELRERKRAYSASDLAQVEVSKGSQGFSGKSLVEVIEKRRFLLD